MPGRGEPVPAVVRPVSVAVEMDADGVSQQSHSAPADVELAPMAGGERFSPLSRLHAKNRTTDIERQPLSPSKL